ncbi:leishmanolysin [Gelidibacter algens]|uniref:Leishmanolysin n=1 Tax=Gelidibacter algens TaxID=49280 RepID=A0A1A7R4E5_9FLAO|nr:leishmanolysin-related zinc metalloendopeptidase [Gelidibacter algens]OBX27125.1 hypothetical protein A9996_01750 [Gelidibacter algens]RAJ27914.1 leishmanolysin [Gelidibacter algens]
MKNPHYENASSKIVETLINPTLIHSTPTPQKKSHFMRLLTFGSILCSLLFISCTDDTIETDASVPDTKADLAFTLAPAESELIRIDGTSSSSEEEFNRASNAAGNDRGRFNITFRYLVDLTPRQLDVFESAAARWERIIIKDVPSFTGTLPSAFIGVPAIEGTVDDIVIEVVIAPIDGPGRILGQAGPRFVRNSDNLTLSGVMFFDVDDLDFLDELDLFEDVIVHEMGHVLGIGTLWNFNRMLRQGPNSNPYFTGKFANIHWNAEGGLNELPIENMGGPGTRLSHWRESLLRNELMTGFINLGENPLSRITAGSLRDLGYGSAMVGEQYDLPKGTPGVDINELAASRSDQGINIAEMEVILEPIGVVSTNE